MLGGEEPDAVTGNLLLDRLLGAKVHWSGRYRKGEQIPNIAERLESAGKRPYVIPYGGSNPIGATGFVEAIRELAFQLKDYAAADHSHRFRLEFVRDTSRNGGWGAVVLAESQGRRDPH